MVQTGVNSSLRLKTCWGFFLFVFFQYSPNTGSHQFFVCNIRLLLFFFFFLNLFLMVEMENISDLLTSLCILIPRFELACFSGIKDLRLVPRCSVLMVADVLQSSNDY